ncbi:hypothetical protein FRC12_024408 [Ceratobasidium sp. 428]|nr:hypothetical protein FRC12_024408 [Ceratobasidium sp. 428]
MTVSVGPYLEGMFAVRTRIRWKRPLTITRDRRALRAIGLERVITQLPSGFFKKEKMYLFHLLALVLIGLVAPTPRPTCRPSSPVARSPVEALRTLPLTSCFDVRPLPLRFFSPRLDWRDEFFVRPESAHARPADRRFPGLAAGMTHIRCCWTRMRAEPHHNDTAEVRRTES